MDALNVSDATLSRPKSARLIWLVIALSCGLSTGIGWWIAGQDTSTDVPDSLLMVFAILPAGALVIARPELLLGVFLAAMGVWTFLPDELISGLRGYRLPLTLVLAGLALLARYGFRPIPIGKAGSALLAFSAYLLISVLWTLAPQNGVFKALAFSLGTTVLYFLVRWTYGRRPTALWRLVVVIALLGLLPLAVTVMASIRVGFGPARRSALVYVINYETDLQVYGLTNGLQLAMICAVALWLRYRRLARRWFWLGLAGMEFWALLALGQRAQILGSVLACGVLLVARKGLRRFARSVKIRIGPKSVLLAALAVVVLCIIAVRSSYKLSPTYMSSDKNISARFRMYRLSFTGFLERPMFGHGLGSFSMDQFGKDARIFSHNIVLELLYETGLIGFFLFIYILCFVFAYTRYLIRYPNTIEGLGIVGLALFVGRLFVGMFSADLSSLNIGPWLAMMAIAASRRSSGQLKTTMTSVAERRR